MLLDSLALNEHSVNVTFTPKKQAALKTLDMFARLGSCMWFLEVSAPTFKIEALRLICNEGWLERLLLLY